MLKIAANISKPKLKSYISKQSEFLTDTPVPGVLPQKAKMLAWAIFLFYFIENGTVGLIPSSFYFIYRNIRISDFILYGLIIYSFFSVAEYTELFRSKSTIILKLLLAYLLVQFFVSCVLYDYGVIEYFFRLKGMWTSFLIFPFMLLMKRKAFPYLAKLVLPVAIVSNILYILSAVTGTAFMPSIGIVKQSLPGGLEVYRVFGGTFYGEFFFLAFIYQWITDKFRIYQLPLVVLFGIPHVLAFGRQAWVTFTLTILMMFIWYLMRKRKLKVALKQIVLLVVLLVSLIYVFIKFVPSSDYLTESIQARIGQGEDDVQHHEGTYGTRLASVDRLIQLWLNNNILFGIGMHPLWVVKPVTIEEGLYAWGFSDVAWASMLAGYGIIGFGMSLFFQFYYMYLCFKILKNTIRFDLYTFLVISFFAKLGFDTFINYAVGFITSGLWGFPASVLFLAAIVYKHEHLND